MVDVLLDGRAVTSGELARTAKVSPSTASEHLVVLTRGGLVTSSVQGRHRYYTLAGAQVASALEALAQICPATAIHSLRQSNQARALSLIRSCYDHLAGTVAVHLLDSLLTREWLVAGREDYALSPAGEAALADLGVDLAGATRRQRNFARPCLDWTERRPHLAGALAAAVAATLFHRGWLDGSHSGRGLRITETGLEGFRDVFGVSTQPIQPPRAPVARLLPASG
jgi:DNA-binding transcriptional ArsR family regulator